jgi:hypothetical protein
VIGALDRINGLGFAGKTVYAEAGYLDVVPYATGPAIMRVEVNQAIQNEGNTIPLIAGKDTVVRVHLAEKIGVDRSRQFVAVGEVGQVWQVYQPIESWGQRVSTLTFDLGGFPIGDKTIVASINGNGATEQVTFVPGVKLRVLVVRVETANGAAPSRSKAESLAEYLTKVYPMAPGGLTWKVYSDVLSEPSLDLQTDEGRSKLGAKLDRLRRSSPAYDIVFGLISPQATLCFDNACLRGCASGYSMGNVPVVVVPSDGTYTNPSNGDTQRITWSSVLKTVAHEIGHQLGLGDEYEVCGYAAYYCKINPPPADYTGRPPDGGFREEGYYSCVDSRSVPYILNGDDIRSGSAVVSRVWAPYDVAKQKSLGDRASLMGNHDADHSWVTSDAYRYMLTREENYPDARGGAVSVSDTVRSTEEASGLFVSGYLDQDGSIELLPAYQLSVAPIVESDGALRIEVLDNQRLLLAYQTFDVTFETRSNPPTPSQRVYFGVEVPWHSGAAYLHIVGGEGLLAEVAVSPNTPTVRIVSPTAGQPMVGEQLVQWEGDDLDGPGLSFTLEYSTDGIVWDVLGSGITGNSALIDFDGLGGSVQSRVRIRASDGVNSTVAESDPFVVAAKAPTVSIAFPGDGTRFVLHESAALLGSAYDPQDGLMLQDAQLTWSSDLDGVIGVGSTMSTSVLSLGRHTLTLSATNSLGLNGSASVLIIVDRSHLYLPLILR